MKTSHAILSSFGVFALAGCATLQVQTDYDPEVSVTQLSTYDWVDQEAGASGVPAIDSPLLKRHIRDAVESELGRMGYRKVTSDTPELRGTGEGELGGIGYPKVTSDTPDFRIAYSLVGEEKSRVDGSYGYGGYGGYGRYGGFGRYGGYGSYGYPGAGYAGGVREYLQGTLVLDIIDVRTGEVIFRGWAKKSLDSNPSPEEVRKYVTKAVAEILEDFPPAGVHFISRPGPFGEAVEY